MSAFGRERCGSSGTDRPIRGYALKDASGPVSAMAAFGLPAVPWEMELHCPDRGWIYRIADHRSCKRGRTARLGLMTVWSPASALGLLPSSCPILRAGVRVSQDNPACCK